VYRQAATHALVTLSAASTVTWHESVPDGAVKVTGRVSVALKLMIRLRPVRSTRIVVARTLSVAKAGAFAASIRLPRTVLPGKYRVSASAGSQTGIEPADADIVIPKPPEGVVSTAFASLRRGGLAEIRVSESVTELWARFQFVARPSASRVAVYWIQPSGKRTGVVVKAYSQIVDTYASGPGPLQRGRWQAVLVAVGKVVKRVSVELS
jgi:hypothetical protein